MNKALLIVTLLLVQSLGQRPSGLISIGSGGADPPPPPPPPPPPTRGNGLVSNDGNQFSGFSNNPTQTVNPYPTTTTTTRTPTPTVSGSSSSSPPAGSTSLGSSGDGQEQVGSPTPNTPSALRSTPLPQVNTAQSYQAKPAPPTAYISSGAGGAQTQRTASTTSFNSQSTCYNSWFWASWCRDFYTECPQFGIWVQLWSPGATWVQINGNWLGPFYGYFGNYVYIPPQHLTCGCNKMCVWVRSHCIWIYYDILAPPQTCQQDCVNNHPYPNDAFYDSRQCKCTCKNRCCPNGRQRPWYPNSYWGCQC